MALDSTNPGCSWVDQVTLYVMILEELALVPPESPHLLTLPEFPTIRVTPLG